MDASMNGSTPMTWANTLLSALTNIVAVARERDNLRLLPRDILSNVLRV